MTPSTVFALASMTKLLTTVACLQLVERGVLTLDGDVSALVPALAAQPVLSGFRDDGSPVTVPRSEPITLRRLLTHSAGPGYMFLDERLMRWKAHQREQRRKEQRAQRSNSTGDKDRKRSSSRSRSSNRSRSSTPSTALEKKKTTLERRFDYPLLFQPGSGWVYGSGVAWAGRVVEVATGTDLETYFAAYVFAPLGITDITFWPGERGGVFTARRAGMTTREPDSGKVVGTEAPEPDTTDCLGGEGAFGALDDYLRVLQSLLADDGRLLRPETAALMFEPQLARAGAGSPDPAAAKQALRASLAHPEWAVGDIPATGEYDWGLGGLLTDGDSHPYRRRGCLIWSGMYNLFWVSPSGRSNRRHCLDRQRDETPVDKFTTHSLSTARQGCVASLGRRSFRRETQQLGGSCRLSRRRCTPRFPNWIGRAQSCDLNLGGPIGSIGVGHWSKGTREWSMDIPLAGHILQSVATRSYVRRVRMSGGTAIPSNIRKDRCIDYLCFIPRKYISACSSCIRTRSCLMWREGNNLSKFTPRFMVTWRLFHHTSTACSCNTVQSAKEKSPGTPC